MFGQVVDWKKSEFISGGSSNSMGYFGDSGKSFDDILYIMHALFLKDSNYQDNPFLKVGTDASIIGKNYFIESGSAIYNNDEAIDFSEYSTVLSSNAVSLKKIHEKEITVYEKKLSSETSSMFHRFILRNNEYKLVKKEFDRVANKVALTTMKSLASFRNTTDANVVLENLKGEDAKLGKKVDELREISSKQSKVNSEKETAKDAKKLQISESLKTNATFDLAAKLAKLDAAKTDNQNSLESVEQKLDSVKQNELDQINHYIENGEVSIEERILPIELKGALEVKTNVFNPEIVVETIALQEIKADSNLKKQILKKMEDYKEDQKGLVRLDLSVYEDDKEFTEKGIIKYYAEKLGGQNYIKKYYEKPFEDNQQEGF
ncbi:15303_t:CDS:2 [Funneliformis caledonium]|uniref:15303_t:CDS:1 n=1 Tax=Funneliformis caledonium TaxID=1117310 RepID=A0A9N9H6W7_9GLOM|nr:15303_t:CDS:2 [Funneliformis caledonium]